MEGRQLVAMAFVELLFLAVLGVRLFRALGGPLLYLFFLVPFGAFVTPALQAFTARFIDVGLTVLGIPHFSHGTLIEIAAGTFYVAEACAGLRFLVAAVAFGVFYALLNYRSPGRRVAFIAASVVVPIVANGIRALGIVVLGQLLGSAQAAAADHIVYGWLFFSVVMLLLVAAGLPLREAPAPPGVAAHPASPPAELPRWPALAVVALAAVGPGTALALDRSATRPVLFHRPEWIAPPGCQATPSPRDAPDRAAFTLSCASRKWTVVFQALPAGSTASRLEEARRAMIGSTDPEQTTVAPMDELPATAGRWQAILSADPAKVAGFAAWIDAEPALGGLRQRMRQARDSIAGGTGPLLLIAVTSQAMAHQAPEDIQQAAAELQRIVAAQTDLSSEAARLTRPDGR